MRTLRLPHPVRCYDIALLSTSFFHCQMCDISLYRSLVTTELISFQDEESATSADTGCAGCVGGRQNGLIIVVILLRRRYRRVEERIRTHTGCSHVSHSRTLPIPPSPGKIHLLNTRSNDIPASEMRDVMFLRQLLHVSRPTQAAQSVATRAPGQFALCRLSTRDGTRDIVNDCG